MLRLKYFIVVGLFLSSFSISFGQKKPLDHTVYDQWQSLGEKSISSNGQWIYFTVDPQEGDGYLVLSSPDSLTQIQFNRGYSASFTPDAKFLIFKIKPPYQDVRNAKIKKIKSDAFPKDSLGIYDLTKKTLNKISNVISYKFPKDSSSWIAYHLGKLAADTSIKKMQKDTAVKKDTSIKQQIPVIIEQTPDKKQKRKLSAKGENDDDVADDNDEDADGDLNDANGVVEGTDLVVQNLLDGSAITFNLVQEYLWSENGKLLVLKSSASKVDKAKKPSVLVWRSIEKRTDSIFTGANDIRNLAIDKQGYQISFLAERDSAVKSLQKFYKIWYWRNGDKEASVLADKFSVGMKANWSISQYLTPYFSKSGSRVFFGTAPIPSIKDTSLIEMDLVKLDIWNYKDDYLQPYQLKNVEQESRRSYLASVDLNSKTFLQLADPLVPQVVLSQEGDGDFYIGISDVGNRISMQWEGATKKNIFEIDPKSGNRKAIVSNLNGMPQISPAGTYVYWYDMSKKGYSVYQNGGIKSLGVGIPTVLYDEEYDMPSPPTPYGIMRWHEKDSFVYVYDRFDVWKVDPLSVRKPENITLTGRKTHTSFRMIVLDNEKKDISYGEKIVLRTFDEVSKHSGISSLTICCSEKPIQLQQGGYSIASVLKSKNSQSFIYTKETFSTAPSIYYSTDFSAEKKLSSINLQQADYNWMTAELFTWKAYNGRVATGIVYKPENFDPAKKYPLIAYFYETLSDGLFGYLPPAPTPSRLNIPFFVSRGYIVLAPDIRYTDGNPGKSAYDYVVSGARALVKKGWVDSTKMGIQGQSWGGYQAAHIITRTPLFAAAWAGAPVANMTSAYGGIRWESGMNRQFQYEKSQSRIGATLWQKPQLYIENSPLFYLPAVKTPLVIMSNDNDGAVPWYQGIELFTAMRRLNKPVWMLNYNGEAHNLVERKNRKDIQIREQQFFDWLLKGEKPAVWLTKGVPATEKGKTWGFETDLDHP